MARAAGLPAAAAAAALCFAQLILGGCENEWGQERMPDIGGERQAGGQGGSARCQSEGSGGVKQGSQRGAPDEGLGRIQKGPPRPGSTRRALALLASAEHHQLPRTSPAIPGYQAKPLALAAQIGWVRSPRRDVGLLGAFWSIPANSSRASGKLEVGL